MAQGLRASSADWYAAKSIYVQMLNSVQVEVIGKGGYQPPVSPRQPPSQEAQEVAEEGGSATSFWEMVFCPKACDWERIDIANQAAGQVWCCSDGCVGQLSQVECTAEQCNASCAQ
jgi:hypothetical protein